MAVITSTVIAAGATIYGAKKGSDAAKDAARAQGQAAESGMGFARESRDMARRDLDPYNQMGLRAMNRLEQLAGGSPRQAGRPTRLGSAPPGAIPSSVGGRTFTNAPSAALTAQPPRSTGIGMDMYGMTPMPRPAPAPNQDSSSRSARNAAMLFAKRSPTGADVRRGPTKGAESDPHAITRRIPRLQDLRDPGRERDTVRMQPVKEKRGIDGSDVWRGPTKGGAVTETPDEWYLPGDDGEFRQGVRLRPQYRSNLQDFNRSGDFQGNIQDLSADTQFNPADTPQRELRTDFQADPRRVYDEASSRVDRRFQDASDVMADQVSSRAAARGKLGSGNTLQDLFRENVMLREGMEQSEFDRLRRLEDRDRMDLSQDESIFANNLARNLAATQSDRQGTALDAQIFGENFGRGVTANESNRLNELARAGMFGDNYNRAMAGADFNRQNEQLRERTFNNNFARNLDVAGLNRQETTLRDALKGADFNRNLSLVNLGQASAAGQAGHAQSTGNTVADLYTQQGNASAAGRIGSANAITGGLNNLAGIAGWYSQQQQPPPVATQSPAFSTNAANRFA